MPNPPRFPKVADFSVHFSGPIASRHLAQLGADVLKVEAPKRGDGNRWDKPRVKDVSVLHFYLSAGARSLVFDARSDQWPDLVAAVARWADVVIVGNTPERAAKLGIDLDSVLAHNPEAVYCAITGYGLDGPLRDFPAHGLNTDAYAGAVPIEDDEEGRPVVPGSYRSFGTSFAGVEAALGILAGVARQRNGLGAQFVHVSIWEAALSWLWRDTAIDANVGQPWLRYRDLGVRYSTYRTADDGVILVCPIEQRFWEAFCDLLGLSPETRARGDWSRGVDYGEGYPEAPEIQEKMATKTRAEWERLCGEARIPIAPILDWREALRGEHAAANGVLSEVDFEGTSVKVPNAPVSVTSVAELDSTASAGLAAAHRAKGGDLAAAPKLGEQTDQALRELGL